MLESVFNKISSVTCALAILVTLPNRNIFFRGNYSVDDQWSVDFGLMNIINEKSNEQQFS